ncbi:uncharacterized protein SCDLUD_002618 [Saccharomycodes ludwigii]|uniref:uncharacterized protein n=1 Tax=Saccharomycodes ludwigii TaxID=36035 RepID=UPI001E87658E|nr:hypothetical protein SCDLUD_002618 [Saccharomycodes ludwigii]KAH3901136.1 hypothetical protein SCDLUD_002618 [Saccharomycodes ludwigii]
METSICICTILYIYPPFDTILKENNYFKSALVLGYQLNKLLSLSPSLNKTSDNGNENINTIILVNPDLYKYLFDKANKCEKERNLLLKYYSKVVELSDHIAYEDDKNTALNYENCKEYHFDLDKKWIIHSIQYKIQLWEILERYDIALYLDCDTLPLQLEPVIDVLRSNGTSSSAEGLSFSDIVASPDTTWPDMFNSGVFIFKPSVETFKKLKAFAYKNYSIDGSDQGLLNQFFNPIFRKQTSISKGEDTLSSHNWKKLPYTYNVMIMNNQNTCNLNGYEAPVCLRFFHDQIKIVHFITKPWTVTDSLSRNINECNTIPYLKEYYNKWLYIYNNYIYPELLEYPYIEKLGSLSVDESQQDRLTKTIEVDQGIKGEITQKQQKSKPRTNSDYDQSTEKKGDGVSKEKRNEKEQQSDRTVSVDHSQDVNNDCYDTKDESSEKGNVAHKKSTLFKFPWEFYKDYPRPPSRKF